ncbi:hypothetical protein AAFF_G00380400 [Aldrovandia affinis]|uniref:Uncharacterized protein n=1 Tax=Aldrovandia affinis TaxID=143900 RepID=A0AAD7T881_9TELE|nr:hypothetical protein AAFF_G00380400 [Aldrovandia affinis]
MADSTLGWLHRIVGGRFRVQPRGQDCYRRAAEERRRWSGPTAAWQYFFYKATGLTLLFPTAVCVRVLGQYHRLNFPPTFWEGGVSVASERHWDTWDPFQLNPIGAEKEEKRRCFVFAQHLVAVIVGLLVLTSAIISKGSLLVLCMFASPNSKTTNGQPFYLLMLVFCLVMPNVMMFLKSLWKCAFKNFVTPNMKTMGIVS